MKHYLPMLQSLRGSPLVAVQNEHNTCTQLALKTLGKGILSCCMCIKINCDDSL